MNKKPLLILLFCISIKLTWAQSCNIKTDSTYFDCWVGDWYFLEGNELASKPSFKVKRALYHSSFEEEWIEPGYEHIYQKAWRAWDSRSKKWDFAWMAADGLFQIWEGKKVDGVWYMYKEFIIGNEPVLSRQAFRPVNDSTFLRTSEHSRDGGESWTLRFQETYRKK